MPGAGGVLSPDKSKTFSVDRQKKGKAAAPETSLMLVIQVRLHTGSMLSCLSISSCCWDAVLRNTV